MRHVPAVLLHGHPPQTNAFYAPFASGGCSSRARFPLLVLGAHAVRNVGYFGPVSPDGQGDRNNRCVPVHRTAQILTRSKNSDKAMFHTENAGLLSKSAVFALQTYASPGVGGLVTENLTYQ